jgi:putative MATE family efflux protein
MVVLLNMVLDPLLIFGWGPVPALGVAGASLASGIAMCIGSTTIIVRMLRGGLGYPVSGLLSQWPKLKRILNIARIGLPVSTQQFVFVFVYWFLIKIVHQFGETAGAAMGIGNRMESLSYLTCYGFSVAAATMVGQNLGAKQPDRAARCAWGAISAAVGITFIISLLFILLPKEISSIFSNDPVVLEIASDYLIILGISQTAMALEIVLEGAFGGAGDTLPPMIVMIPGSAIRIPLAYYLCFNLDWGINGVWWTLTITCALKAIVLSLWFKRGKWKLKEV